MEKVISLCCVIVKARSAPAPEVPLLSTPTANHYSYNIQTVLEITVGHWPFSDQFQHLADQNPFWSAKFTVNFQQKCPIFKKWPTNF